MDRRPIRLEANCGRVDLWAAAVEPMQNEAALAACRRLLSDEETAQAARFRFERDRDLYVVAHALVRTALSCYAEVPPWEWRFQTVGHGKPLIAAEHGSTLRFNLSHTRGMAVCAVTAAGEIGVDVEFLGRARSDLELAERYFAPAETATLVGLSPETLHDRFLQFWTLKESYIKAVGTGLSMPLDCFAFQLADGRPPVITFTDPTGEPHRWQFAQVRLGRQHIAAIALQDAAAPLVLHAASVRPPLAAAGPAALPAAHDNRWRLEA